MTDFISQLNLNNERIECFQIKEDLNNIINPLLFKLESDIERFEERHAKFYQEHEKIKPSTASILKNSLNQMKRIIFVRIQYIVDRTQSMIKTLTTIDNETINLLNQTISELRGKENYLLKFQ